MPRLILIIAIAVLSGGAGVYSLRQFQDNPPTTTEEVTIENVAPQAVVPLAQRVRVPDALQAVSSAAATETPVQEIKSAKTTPLFDQEDLKTRLRAARLEQARSRSALESAKQNEILQELKMQAEADVFKRTLEKLRLDREAYRQGEAVRRREDLQGAVLLAQRHLKLTNTKLLWTERLADKGLVNQYRLESDRAAALAAQDKLKADQDEFQTFQSSAYQRQLTILDRQVELAKAELDRIVHPGKLLRAKHRTDTSVKQTAWQTAQEKVARWEQQLQTMDPKQDS